MPLAVRPLTPQRFGDLEAIFEAKGCSVARGCWCMYYRVSGKGDLTRPGPGARTQRKKSALQALAAKDPPPGLIGYRGMTPVGWVSLGPRADYAKLAKSPVMRPVDEQPVWAIVCFVVPSALALNVIGLTPGSISIVQAGSSVFAAITLIVLP